MKKRILCEACEASYEIKHDMDESYFPIAFCPFCGEQQETEELDYNADEEDYD